MRGTVVIVGGTYQAAQEELKSIYSRIGAAMKKGEFTTEATVDGRRIVAMGGSRKDVCWLRELGFHIEKIIVVEPDLVSEEMGKRINHVRSTIASGR